MKKINLSNEKKKEMHSLLKEYFNNERNEELGDLAVTLLLDYIIEEIAPEFYNQGVYDAHNFVSTRLEDIFELQIYKR